MQLKSADIKTARKLFLGDESDKDAPHDKTVESKDLLLSILTNPSFEKLHPTAARFMKALMPAYKRCSLREYDREHCSAQLEKAREKLLQRLYHLQKSLAGVLNEAAKFEKEILEVRNEIRNLKNKD